MRSMFLNISAAPSWSPRVVHEGGKIGHGVGGLAHEPGLIGDFEGLLQVDPGGLRIAEAPVDQAKHVQVVGLAALVADPLIDFEGREQHVLSLAELALVEVQAGLVGVDIREVQVTSGLCWASVSASARNASAALKSPRLVATTPCSVRTPCHTIS